MVWIRALFFLAASALLSDAQNATNVTAPSAPSTTVSSNPNSTAFVFDPSVLDNVADPWKRPALNISHFQQVSSDSIIDAWTKIASSGAAIDPQRFSLAVMNDTVYLISARQLVQNDSSMPEVSPVRGGVVSTFDIPTKIWIHKPYDRLDEDKYDGYTFGMKNSLFMLLVARDNNNLVYSKLFYWNMVQAKWIEVPITLDKDAFLPLHRDQLFLNINVPDQDGNIAYVTATDHSYAETDAMTIFSKLDVQFNDTAPISASLTKITNVHTMLGAAIITSAVVDKTLYALVGHFQPNANNVAQVSIDFTVDLRTDETNHVTFIGAIPSIDATGYKQDRIFQLRNYILYLGPHQLLTGGIDQHHVWLLEMLQYDQLIWRETDAVFPDRPYRVFAIDQKNANIVTADLKNGIYVSPIYGL